MSHSFFHAKSSVRTYGGNLSDYLALHNWFDATKCIQADFRHRALRHHQQGIELSKQVFGEYINGIPINILGYQHNKEDFGANPDYSEWYQLITLEDWMKGSSDVNLIYSNLIRKFGGKATDYIFLVDFFTQFDNSDPRSKYILNHSWGIFDAESVFGITFLRNSDSKEMATRTLAETVVMSRFNGKIPTPSEWISSITSQPWMYSKAVALSRELV